VPLQESGVGRGQREREWQGVDRGWASSERTGGASAKGRANERSGRATLASSGAREQGDVCV
jgi:hypothetical protein